jgi:conjugative relaxase-like TrwC/TraI family protein
VDDEQFLALMAGLDPRDPERLLGNGYSEKSVRGFDVTASSPKSVSVLWAVGDDWVRAEVLAAHDAAVAAVAGWVEAHAHTRFRLGGEVVVVDAEGIVAAGFRQHTSRALDPQLHTHLVVANRVKSPDGRWLALDARTLKRDQRTLSALFHAAERAELTRRLGVEWGPVVNGIAEIDGIDRRVMEEFSTRTKAVSDRLSVKLDRFEQTMGREPTQRERWQLEREAAVDSRPAKDHAVNAEVLHERWVGQVRDLGIDPDALVAGVIGRSLDAHRDVGDLDPLAFDRHGNRRVGRAAVVVASGRDRPRARRPVPNDARGDRGGGGRCGGPARLRDRCRSGDGARPTRAPEGVERRGSDGRPITESALDRAITQWWILEEEAFVLDWAACGIDPTQHRCRTGRPSTAARPRRRAHSERRQLRSPGPHPWCCVVGPAGTGKTTAMRPAVEQLRADGRVVFGVAPSAIAASVLTTETGVRRTRSTSSSHEHRTGPAPSPGSICRPGATVIVDEAGMVVHRRSLPNSPGSPTNTRGGWRWSGIRCSSRRWVAAGCSGCSSTHTAGSSSTASIASPTTGNATPPCSSVTAIRAVADVYDREGRLHGGTVESMERAAIRQWWRHWQAARRRVVDGALDRHRWSPQPDRPTTTDRRRRTRRR